MTSEHTNSDVLFFSGSRLNRKVHFGFVMTYDEVHALIQLAEAKGGLSEAATLQHLIRRVAKEQGLAIK